MNKQEIVALINAAIAGQGSQVDISGKLPAILSSIVDLIPEGGNTPLVINGKINPEENMFTPAVDQPSRAVAIAAFADGRPVYFKSGNFFAAVVSKTSNDELVASTGLGYLQW